MFFSHLAGNNADPVPGRIERSPAMSRKDLPEVRSLI